MHIYFRYETVTDQGLYHSENEDSILCIKSFEKANQHLFLICDGVGGYPGGKIASGKIIRKFAKSINKIDFNANLENQLEEIIDESNQEILDYVKQNPEFKKMSSTVAGIAISGHKLISFNVGDSRVYIRDRKGFRQLTTDDSLAWKRFEKGLISKSDILNQEDKHRISSALGFGRSITPHFNSAELERYFQVLICSDGLTDFLPEERIEEILSLDDDLRVRVGFLMQEARSLKSDDDISVILIEGNASDLKK